MNKDSAYLDLVDRAFKDVQDKIDPGLFLSALFAALLAAFAASLMYRFFYERRGTGSQVHRAFPLLALSVTALFIGVQVSIPLSLGLLGSLSIIRFRTPIKEPEEVGFIMLVIAASICAATFNFSFIIYLYLFAFAALLVSRGFAGARWLRRDGILVLTLPAAVAAEKGDAIEEALRDALARHAMESSATRDGITTLQYVFSGLRGDAMSLQAALAKAATVSSVNIFLDRPGGIR